MSATAEGTAGATPGAARRRGASAGWTAGLSVFAALLLIMMGVMQALEGLAALIHGNFFSVSNEYAYRANTTGSSGEARWRFLADGLSRFAGRGLDLDLAVMGATLADGGVNPLTGDRVVGLDVARVTLAVMVVAGLYETSGDWLVDVGVPGKSGIGGGIVAVSPGKGALGTYSPRLDPAGNSVRGQLAARALAGRLGLDLLASAPEPAPQPAREPAPQPAAPERPEPRGHP
ncbi:MAG: DUF7144 family membrane protein [Kineosporiaceae bacterium]